MTELVFRADRLVLRLVDGGVRFVVIGGFAGQLHGSSLITYDLDICYARDDANIAALVVVLTELRTTLRGAPPDVPFRLDVVSIRNGDAFTFNTELGPLDILGTVARDRERVDYDAFLPNAVEVELEGRTFKVAGLDDIMAMKRAAGRPKDLIALENLGALREEIDRRPD